MNSNVGTAEAMVVGKSLRVAGYFSIAAAVPVLFLAIAVGMAYRGDVYYVYLIFFAIAQLLVVGYLAFCLLLLLIDAQVMTLAVEDLINRCESKTIDIMALAAVREDVRARVQSGRLATDLVLLPCIGSLVSVILVLFWVDSGKYYSTYDLLSSIGRLLVFTKEVLFVAIALWYVAEANGKADELTIRLSRTVWSPGADCVPDVARLSVHASSVSEPISFALLHRRVGWRDVALNSVGFGFSLLVGFVKYAVGL
jgi:hypothetical protein